MNRQDTKIVVSIGTEFFNGARRTRVGYAAAVVAKDESEQIACGHYAHRTTEAAVRCARKVWDRLPEKVA